MSNIAAFQAQDLEIADLEQAAGGFTLGFSYSRPKSSSTTTTTTSTDNHGDYHSDIHNDNRNYGLQNVTIGNISGATGDMGGGVTIIGSDNSVRPAG
ncbi:MAG TPA: hypothetical protein VI299_23355 [Polyangiales bacterium]